MEFWKGKVEHEFTVSDVAVGMTTTAATAQSHFGFIFFTKCGQNKFAQDREVASGVAGLSATAILTEDNIKHLVEVVLDVPVPKVLPSIATTPSTWLTSPLIHCPEYLTKRVA